MHATMDAVDENLDKLSDALKDRFRKLVSSQISLLKYTMPNLQPINVQVNIKHREVRISSPNAESPDVEGEDTFNEEQSKLVNEGSVSKSEEVTTIQVKQNYQGEIKYDETSTGSRAEAPSSNAANDDKLVKRTYQKVTYRKKLMKTTSTESPSGLRNTSYEGAENTNPLHGSCRSTEHEGNSVLSPLLHGTRPRSPVVTKERIEGPVIIRNSDRSPVSRTRDAKSPVTARTAIRSHKSKITRIVSPLSRRQGAESPVSMKNARSPLTSHRNFEDPLPIRDRNGSPMWRRSSPENLLSTGSSPRRTIDHSPVYKSLDVGNSILAKHLVRSPMSVRNNTQYMLPSRSVASSPTRRGKISPPNSSTATRSPVSPGKTARSPSSARGSRSPQISANNARSPLRSAERSPLSVRGAMRSPTLSRKEVHSAIYESKYVDSRIVPRKDERNDKNSLSESPVLPSTTVSTRRLTTNREINEVVVAGRPMSAMVRHRMPSPVDRKLQTVINRLESYNKTVSPRMEKIKNALSPEKVLKEKYSPALTKLPRNDGVATKESKKFYKRFEHTVEERSSHDINNTKYTRTNTETSEQRSFTISPRPLPNESTNRASYIWKSENFPKQHLNDYVEKALALPKNERNLNPAPIPDKRHGKEKQSEYVSTRSPGVSCATRRFNRQKEYQQLTSPVSDDLTMKCKDVCRKIDFSSPTEVPTASPVSPEIKKERNISVGYVSFNDTLNSCEVVKYKDNNSTPVTDHSRSFPSETPSHSGGVSTLLIDSLDEMDQRPLAHSTPIAEDSTVRYLPVSQSTRQPGDSFVPSLNNGRKNFCVSCYEKEIKQSYMLERDKKRPEKCKDAKDIVRISNEREIERGYSKAHSKDLNNFHHLNSFDHEKFVDREDKFVKNGEDSSISKGSVRSKGSTNSDRKIVDRSPTSKANSSAVRKRTQKEMYVNDGRQNIKKVSRETKELKRYEKNNETSMSEEHRIVKQLACNGEEKEMQQVKMSNYTTIIQNDHGKQTYPEETHADLVQENLSQPNAVIEKKTLKQLKHTVVRTTQENEKATQANMTLEEHLALKELEYEKNENDFNNEKMTQVNMTKEEQELLRQLKPCISAEELGTEQVKQRHDNSKVKKVCQKEYLEIQTKSTVGSQTEIIEELKSLTTHEESSQTGVYVQPETTKQREKLDEIFPYSENEKIHQDTVTCSDDKEKSNAKEIDIGTLQRAYEDIQSRLHVSATAALVSAAKDALKKSIDDDFHRELWIGRCRSVHFFFFFVSFNISNDLRVIQ